MLVLYVFLAFAGWAAVKPIVPVNSCKVEEEKSFALNNFLRDVNNILVKINAPFDLLKLAKANEIISETKYNSNEQPFSDKCFNDVLYFFKRVEEGDIWALRMLDSYGKLGSGMLEGRLKWYGDYDECLDVRAPLSDNADVGGFDGQYCNLNLDMSMNQKNVTMEIGICLPDSCNQIILLETLQKLLETLGIQGRSYSMANTIRHYSNSTDFSSMDGNMTVGYKDCCPAEFQLPTRFEVSGLTCQPPPSRPFSTGALVMIFVFSCFILATMIGTCATIYENMQAPQQTEPSPNPVAGSDGSSVISYSEKESQPDSSSVRVLVNQQVAQVTQSGWLVKSKRVLKCFCIITNLKKLFHTEPVGEMLFIHGLRYLNMNWIILSHTVGFAFTVVASTIKLLRLVDHWPAQIILNGFYAVDTFFYLSGFLVTYTCLKKEKVDYNLWTLTKFYAHRIIRITPLYWSVILFYMYIFPYLGSGPNWIGDKLVPVCEQHWLFNFFYLNNFMKSMNQCLSWSWYLANDMQFYLISPLFLVLLRKFPKVGYTLVVGFLCTSIVTIFVLTLNNNLITGLGNLSSKSENLEVFLGQFIQYFDILYVPPYARIAPFLIGMLQASFLYKRDASQLKLSKNVLCYGWTFFVASLLYFLFGLYHWDPPVLAASFHNALSRTIFAIDVAWIVHVCSAGQGGIVNTILSWKAFIPLSRLTYSVYLIHPVIYTLFLYGLPSPLELTGMTLMALNLAVTASSYLVAIPVSLLFETPIIRLGRLYLV